jgi:hypothetical protein
MHVSKHSMWRGFLKIFGTRHGLECFPLRVRDWIFSAVLRILWRTALRRRVTNVRVVDAAVWAASANRPLEPPFASSSREGLLPGTHLLRGLCRRHGSRQLHLRRWIRLPPLRAARCCWFKHWTPGDEQWGACQQSGGFSISIQVRCCSLLLLQIFR